MNDSTKPSWVDPRRHPKPPAPPPRCDPTDDPQEIVDLLAFCRSGRIYDIERWIMAGKPLQATNYDVYPDLEDVRIYRHAKLETDLVVHLHRATAQQPDRPCECGERLASMLRAYGLVEHSMWVEAGDPSE